MRRELKLRNYKITKLQNSSGYILLTLMLFMTLLTMAALAVLPEIVQQIQRDREEEMVHRGTEYMRAIKKYYKKFGRYPTRVEELENTNQIRFLRKRYKDPLLKDAKQKGERDFKFVRVGDPILNGLGVSGPGIGQGVTPGPNQAQGLGQLPQGAGAQMVGALGGGVRPAGPNDTNTPQVTGLPGQQGPGTANQAGDSSDKQDATEKESGASSSDAGSGGQVFGGGPILGVASTSKAKTIREFNKKSHYNEWVFIYDPRSDRGGLLKGPFQPNPMGGGLGGEGNGLTPAGQAQPTGGAKPTGPQPQPQQGQQESPEEQ